ncbi:hypothetical protein, partial [Stenotrophomonas lactitubi]|uniref:hypothetical protein n=1 Tax=Stenotrophomonas lactitubi TaxID=2045214 RepID=UPI001E52BA7F
HQPPTDIRGGRSSKCNAMAWVLVGADLGPHHLSDVMDHRRKRPALCALATIESRCMSQIARSFATLAPPVLEAVQQHAKMLKAS